MNGNKLCGNCRILVNQLWECNSISLCCDTNLKWHCELVRLQSVHSLLFQIGVEPSGLKAGQRAPFTVDAKAAGDGELDVFVEGPLGEEKVDVKNNGDGTYSCCYYPGKFGKYVASVTWSSVQVPNSPFNVKVAPAVDASRIKAYGPGLEKGMFRFLCH